MWGIHQRKEIFFETEVRFTMRNVQRGDKSRDQDNSGLLICHDTKGGL
jgi:3-phenylpropionate/cinnamic acid dioxygenase small subunit